MKEKEKENKKKRKEGKKVLEEQKKEEEDEICNCLIYLRAREEVSASFLLGRINSTRECRLRQRSLRPQDGRRQEEIKEHRTEVGGDKGASDGGKGDKGAQDGGRRR